MLGLQPGDAAADDETHRRLLRGGRGIAARFRAPLLVLGLVSLLGALGGTAQASFRLAGGGSSVVAPGDARWFVGQIGCAGSSLNGTVTSPTQLTVRPTFSSGGRTPCVYGVIRAAVAFTCTGTMTLNSTSSVAGVSATGTWTLDSNFDCGVNRAGACTYRISGTQGPFSWTFSQGTQQLTVRGNVTVLYLAGTPCWTGITVWDLDATYLLTTRLVIA